MFKRRYPWQSSLYFVTFDQKRTREKGFWIFLIYHQGALLINIAYVIIIINLLRFYEKEHYWIAQINILE